MDIISMAEGAGGEKEDKLIKKYILKYFRGQNTNTEVSLENLDDSSIINGIAFTTDSHTVKPLFFPGGDIGSLAVAGTVNDLAVMGAKPLALSAAFIIEEGFEKEKFEKVLRSMKKTSDYAKVPIITGDTKVVERGAIQEMIVNTSGIGLRSPLLDRNLNEVKRYRKLDSAWLLDSNLSHGDKIILSGRIGEHGIALLSFREGYGFESSVKSDVSPINGLMDAALNVGGIVSAKDPTRGGLANTLNEFSEKSGVGMIIYEESIPISEGVKSACEMLGIDPLEIGNEGKVVLGVVKEKADDVLDEIKKHPLGRDAAIIGEVREDIKEVVMETVIGGKRIIHRPIGDPIPRIC